MKAMEISHNFAHCEIFSWRGLQTQTDDLRNLLEETDFRKVPIQLQYGFLLYFLIISTQQIGKKKIVHFDNY